MPEEIFDVVNERDEVIGKKLRREVHRDGDKHRAVHVLIFNSRSEVFLQKRSMTKDTFPGAWDSSSSGHLDCGEDYDACAIREVREELGLQLENCPARLFKIEACAETGQEFVWVYRCEHEGPFVLHPEEIESGGWFAPEQVTKWISEFMSLPRTVANGVKLLTGLKVVKVADQTSQVATPEAELASYMPQLKEYLAKAPYNLADANKFQKQFDAMQAFIVGKLDTASGKFVGGYLGARTDEKVAFDFLTKGGVLNFDGGVRRYIGMFEGARQSWLASLNGPVKQPIVAHIAEGQQKDSYNHQEYLFLKQFGLNKPGMVMIHSVGLDKNDFTDAAKNKLSIV